MIRWTEREDAYRLTISWGDSRVLLVLLLAWVLLVSLILGAPKGVLVPTLAGAGVLLMLLGLAYRRSARQAAWIDVDARGGYASWCTTGLMPQDSPIGVARFVVEGTAGSVAIVAVLPSGDRRVAICRADLPQRANAHQIVARLNEFLQVPQEDRAGEEESAT